MRAHSFCGWNVLSPCRSHDPSGRCRNGMAIRKEARDLRWELECGMMQGDVRVPEVIELAEAMGVANVDVPPE